MIIPSVKQKLCILQMRAVMCIDINISKHLMDFQ